MSAPPSPIPSPIPNAGPAPAAAKDGPRATSSFTALAFPAMRVAAVDVKSPHGAGQDKADSDSMRGAWTQTQWFCCHW